MDWLDLLAVQGTLKCLLQHHSSKALILQVSAFSYVGYIGHNFSSKEQASFNFLAAVTIHSDFGAQENKEA